MFKYIDKYTYNYTKILLNSEYWNITIKYVIYNTLKKLYDQKWQVSHRHKSLVKRIVPTCPDCPISNELRHSWCQLTAR